MMFAFHELKIDIDHDKKAQSIHGLDQAIHSFTYQKPLTLDFKQVIYNQARYLNHLTYIIYGLIIIMIGFIGIYASFSDALITMGIIAGLLPLMSMIECHDAKRYGLEALHRSYPFDHRLVLTIRFIYLTIINSIVVNGAMVLYNGLTQQHHFGLTIILIYLMTLLILSMVSLVIALTIKRMQWALIINGSINGLVIFTIITIVIDFYTIIFIMISVCIVLMGISIIVWSVMMHWLYHQKAVWIK